MKKHSPFNPKSPDATALLHYIQSESSGPVSTILRTPESPGQYPGHGAIFVARGDDGDNIFSVRKVDKEKRTLERQIYEFGGWLRVDDAFINDLIAKKVPWEEARKQIVCESARVINQSTKKFDPFAPLSIDELDSYVFDPDAAVPPEETFYKGLLSRGDLTIWIGEEKHRKSNFILELAICASVGRDFLGFKFESPRPLPVVLVDYETKTASLKKRLDGITKALNLTEVEAALLRTNFKVIEIKRILKSGHVFPKFPHTARTQANQGGNSDDIEFWQKLVSLYPADLYIIDPMRSMHSGDENDSRIEALLSEMRRVFRNATVIAAHHMRKSGDDSTRSLLKDMRAWSDGARGSSAFKAHADVILCQERTTDDHGNEVVYLGAFLKDGADIEPFPSMESDHESYFFQPTMNVRESLKPSFDALKTGGGKFADKAAAVQRIKAATNAARTTAYRHVDELIRAGLVIEKPDFSLIVNAKAAVGG